MTVLMETHLIPNPHLNLFLSRMTHTHTEKGATRQHFPELLPHCFPVGAPAVSMVFTSFITQPQKNTSGPVNARDVLSSLLY